MSHTNILKESIIINIEMNWQNIQHMDKRERRILIREVINMSKSNTSFVIWSSKFHLAYLIHHSECYFNGKGWTTNVKEFEKLGWYNQDNQLDVNKIMKA